jgi:hypothetical protein
MLVVKHLERELQPLLDAGSGDGTVVDVATDHRVDSILIWPDSVKGDLRRLGEVIWFGHRKRPL